MGEILFGLMVLSLGIWSGYNIGRMPGDNFLQRSKAYFTFTDPVR
jgi:membrane protein DedA with SNARE-associated domain